MTVLASISTRGVVCPSMADNSPAFWLYNHESSVGSSSSHSSRASQKRRSEERTTRRQDIRKARQAQILKLLIEAGGQPVHVSRIAGQSRRLRDTTVKFMMTHDDGLWVSGSNAAWWRTTLRTIPDRLR
jgi:hypothetical protein